MTHVKCNDTSLYENVCFDLKYESWIFVGTFMIAYVTSAFFFCFYSCCKEKVNEETMFENNQSEDIRNNLFRLAQIDRQNKNLT